MSRQQRFIVGEVSLTYDLKEDIDSVIERVKGPMGTIAKRFEHIIDVNARADYQLHSWRFSSVPQYARVGSVEMSMRLTETIVAVFELDQPS